MNRALLVPALALALLCLLPAHAVRAEGAPLVYWSGEITDGQGSPLSGIFALTFRLHPDTDSRDTLWAESRWVTVHEGAYRLRLGTRVALPPEFTGQNLTLSVEMGGTELVRSPLTITPAPPRQSREQILAGLEITFADLAERAVVAEEAQLADDCLRVGGKTLEELDRYDSILQELVAVREEVSRATRATVGGRTTTLERAGGAGGLPYARNCPPGHVVVGIRGGAGALVDSVELVCAPIE